MSIAYQCRELVAGPTVGYQVGGQGDGSAYNVRQQPHQQQQAPHQQPQQMRGLSCFSIYVHSSEDKGTWRDAADGLGGDSHGVLRAVGKEQWLVDPPQSAVAGSGSGLGLGSGSVLLGISKDSGCNLGAECKVGSGDSNYRGGGLTGDALFQDSSVFASPKDSVSEASSSIGENDSVSCSTDDDDETAGDMEVESKLKGPLDCLAELEDSLPIKRGLSNFFTGKSKSFTCLADVASVKDLSKPDNPYNKRRRNLIYSGSWDRNRFHLPRSSSSGISKKGMHTSKSTLALAVAMSQSEDSSERDEKDVHLPPLPPQGKWQRSFASPRSFSLTDLQGV